MFKGFRFSDGENKPVVRTAFRLQEKQNWTGERLRCDAFFAGNCAD
jgi:hypothetical protein